MRYDRIPMALAAMGIAVVLSLPASAQTVDDTIRGDIDSGGVGAPAAIDNNYFAGSSGQEAIRSYFDFVIPTLGGPIGSATLELDQPGGTTPGHSGGDTTLSVFNLGVNGMPLYSDMSSGTLYGTSATLNDATDGTTVDIALNAGAIAAIQADSGGGNFNLYGVSSGENASTLTGDFGFTYPGGPQPWNSVLVLAAGRQQPIMPEPGPLAFAAASGFGLLGFCRRRRLLRY
jgi:hypothetical protein